MTWFRIDDSFGTHPKVLGIPRKDRATAVGLWTLAGIYSALHLTDGLVGVNMVDELGVPKRYAQLLVKAGLWHVPGDECTSCFECEKCEKAGVLTLSEGYRFHDWHDYQPARIDVEKQRKAERERKAAARAAAAAKRAAADASTESTGRVVPYDIRAVNP